jgi:hypothetical protein
MTADRERPYTPATDRIPLVDRDVLASLDGRGDARYDPVHVRSAADSD